MRAPLGSFTPEELYAAGGLRELDAQQWPGTRHVAKCYGVICGKNSLFVAYEFGGTQRRRELWRKPRSEAVPRTGTGLGSTSLPKFASVCVSLTGSGETAVPHASSRLLHV